MRWSVERGKWKGRWEGGVKRARAFGGWLVGGRWKGLVVGCIWVVGVGGLEGEEEDRDAADAAFASRRRPGVLLGWFEVIRSLKFYSHSMLFGSAYSASFSSLF